MKNLNDNEFKRFKELEKLVKAKKATKAEVAEFMDLKTKKESKPKPEFKPGNDFSWWNKIPELTRDSATFKCNWIPGTQIAPGVFTEEGVGVLQVPLLSVLENSIAPTDPVNIWARDLYLRMFQKYRPASGYSASDLGIAILAGIEAVKLIATYERIYGIINRYSKLNVNMPILEARALGLSTTQVTHLQGHMSDFRYDLNYLIRKAQRLCIPKDISAVADAITLFGYEYMDHESARSQFILFTQADYGKYDDLALSSGGSIKFNDISGLFNFSADNMCVLLNDVLNALLGSDSIQRIYADLVVWFGEAAMLQFVAVPEEYMVVPVKSESILHRLHNMETTDSNAMRVLSFVDGNLSSADQGVIAGQHFVYQCDDRIVTSVDCVNIPSGATSSLVNATVHGIAGQYTYTSAQAPRGLTGGHLIDTVHTDITPDIIVEGVLFKFNCTTYSSSGLYGLNIDSAGFYIPKGMILWRNTAGAGSMLSTGYVSPGQVTDAAGQVACIDWAPLLYVFSGGGASAIYGDYDNIVFVSNPDAGRIHRTIILSGLNTDVTVVNK